MRPFTFELVITGMCILEFNSENDLKSCTIKIPRADKLPDEFKKLPKSRQPFLHFPFVSYPTRFQVAYGGKRRRDPDYVSPASDGDEIGVSDLTGEALQLKVKSNIPLTLKKALSTPGPQPSAGQETLFHWAVRLDRLVEKSECTFDGVDDTKIATSILIENGEFSTAEVGQQSGEIIRYQFGKVIENPASAGERSLADAVVLRLDGVTDRVILDSDHEDKGFAFSASRWTNLHEPVRVCISNFHETLQPSRRGLFDFLWYYHALNKLLDKSGKPPSPRYLVVPWIPPDMPGQVTGSSSHCPPGVVYNAQVAAEPIRVRVVGPDDDTENKYPDCVKLLDAEREIIGSGVLVSSKVILTAGHNLEAGPHSIDIVTTKGTTNVTLTPETYRRPDGYSGDDLSDDLLLWRLEKEVEPAMVTPVARATAAEIDAATDATVAGFGFGDGKEEGIRRFAVLTIQSPGCAKPGDPVNYGCHAAKEIVTSQSGGGGIYLHDSGSPLYITVSSVRKLAGIASRRGDSFAIYHRSEAGNAWLKDNIKELQDLP